VAHVVEHTSAEHEVERSDFLRAQVMHIKALVFDLALEVLVRQQKSIQAAMIPGVGVDRQDSLGTSALEFETEEAVPGADIEHGLTGQVVRDPHQLEPPAEPPMRVWRLGGEAVTEVERGMEERAQRLESGAQAHGAIERTLVPALLRVGVNGRSNLPLSWTRIWAPESWKNPRNVKKIKWPVTPEAAGSSPVAPARFQAIDWFRLLCSEVRNGPLPTFASSVLAKTGDERYGALPSRSAA
jgi:hypothetical protein